MLLFFFDHGDQIPVQRVFPMKDAEMYVLHPDDDPVPGLLLQDHPAGIRISVVPAIAGKGGAERQVLEMQFLSRLHVIPGIEVQPYAGEDISSVSRQSLLCD